jgi:hypothetical protein
MKSGNKTMSNHIDRSTPWCVMPDIQTLLCKRCNQTISLLPLFPMPLEIYGLVLLGFSAKHQHCQEQQFEPVEKNQPNCTPQQYAEDIYRSFCEDDETSSILATAWRLYEDKHGKIETNSKAEELVFAAIYYAVKGLLMRLDNEEHDRNLPAESWDAEEELKPLDIKSPPQ